MATTLIFLRHGQSEGNKLKTFNGSLDFPLTEIGNLQAEKSAEFLDKYKIDYIYSSDLKRAYQTAEQTAKRQNLPIIKSKNLREIHGGDFEGIKFDEISLKFPKEFDLWVNDMGNCVCPKGESIKELFERVKNEVNEIARKHTGKTVLIATHATPIRAMSTLWLKKNIEDIRDVDWVKNASVTVVNYDDIENPEVLLYDEHKHLNDILTELPSTI